MSFFDQVRDKQRQAKERADIELKKEYLRRNVPSDHDRLTIENVKQHACLPAHRSQILDTAASLSQNGVVETSYVLYRGNELESLNHLNLDVRKSMLDKLLDEIKEHYGKGFTVIYSDATYDGSNVPAGRSAEIRLAWPCFE